MHIDPLPIRVLHLSARWGRLRGLGDWRPAACLFDRGTYLPRPFLPSFSLAPTFPFSPRSLRSCLGFLAYGFFDPRRRCRSRCVTRAVEVRTLSSSGGSNLLVFFLTQCPMRSFSSSGCLRSSYRPFTAQGEARGGDGLGELSLRERLRQQRQTDGGDLQPDPDRPPANLGNFPRSFDLLIHLQLCPPPPGRLCAATPAAASTPLPHRPAVKT